MTQDQLDDVVAATGHRRYRWLTSEANPDPVSREGYRRLVASKATAYPPLATQARNLAASVAAHVADGLATVDDAELDRRMTICRSCPSFDATAVRCRECGCHLEVKARWRSGNCPSGRWATGGATSPR